MQDLSSDQTDQKQSAGIKLRKDLEIISFPDGSIQVSDPVTVRHFHLGFDEAEAIKMLEIMHPLEICKRSSYSEDDLKQFLGMLKQWGLLEGTAAPAIQSTKKKTVLQFMFQRFKLSEPDSMLEDLIPKVQWTWSKPAQIIYFILITFTGFLMVKEGERFMHYGWPLINDSWIITLICFVILLFTVLAGHEIAHGVALKYFGGSVPEMGFYFAYMTPALYTDVSDIYRLKKTSQKIWVMLAGLLFQGGIGCLAYLLWSQAVEHSGLADLLYLTVTASFFSLSINLNPLIRLDGYYVLQLALNIYALRRRAWSYVRSLVFNEEPEEILTPRERKVFLLYAPLSVIYTCFTMILIMSFYFGQTFMNFPALTGFLAILLFLASQTPMPNLQPNPEP